MSKKEQIEKVTNELALPIIDEMGLSLYDIEYVKEGQSYFLRIYIDKDGGVTIDDCEAFSRRFNIILDEKDYIDDAYTFEVSSPGLGRRLTKACHFEKSLGEAIEVKLYKPIDGQKLFSGVLKGHNDSFITIDANGTDIEFDKSDIADCRLAIDF